MELALPNGADLRLECQHWETPGAVNFYSPVTPGGWTVSVSADGTRMVATMPGGEIGGENICIVRVSNTDGSYFDFQAVVTRAPAIKVDAWTIFDEHMIEARRGHRSDVAEATSSSKYLYAVGGDAGSLQTAKNKLRMFAA